MSGGRLRYLVTLTVLVVAYYITAKIGLSLDAVGGFATVVWPPSGIALAALLIFGWRYWPGITLAAFLVNLTSGAPPLVAAGIGIGNTLEPLIGYYLLTRLTHLHHQLDRLKDVLGLVVYAAIFSTSISATIGVTSLMLGNVIEYGDYGTALVAWWSGDMLGVLVVSPLLLVWNERIRRPIELHCTLKAILTVTILILVSYLVFHGFVEAGMRPFVLGYVIFPVLMWIVIRFEQTVITAAIFLVACVAIWGTVDSFDPANGDSLSQTLLLLQVFIGATAITFMSLAAVVAEREITLKQNERVAQKAEMLAKQRERLKLLNESKDEFISIASHQLRTPATSVKQYLGILLHGYGGKLNQEQKAFAKTAYESNEQQLQIINNLLQVAQLDSGKINVKKSNCDVNEIITEIIDHHSRVFTSRDQKLVFIPNKKSIKAKIDRNLIRMMLENIIDNAGKYSPKGGNVNITAIKKSGELVFEVTDHGVGISLQDQKKLFRKFSRLSNPQTGAVSGSGLGLYWAKKIVSMHGGSISLISEPKKGTTVSIKLPV